MRRQFGKAIVEIARQDPQVVPGLEKMSAAKRGEKNPMYGTISPNRRKNA